jgi:hypothetical protein
MSRRATKVEVLRRTDDVLRLLLEGQEWWGVREFVREKEAEPGSAWFLAEGEPPLSDGMLRRYQQRADKLIFEAHERSRKKLFRRHLARRRYLYSRAVAAGDFRTALACARDEAEMLSLYPPKKTANTHEVGGRAGGGIPVSLTAHEGDIAEDVKPYEEVLRLLAGGGEAPPDYGGGCNGAAESPGR